MATTLDQARGLIGIVGRLCGTRAGGKASFNPPLTAPVAIGRNMWLAAVINGSIRPDLIYRVLPNPANADGSWQVTGSQTIDVESLCGGVKQNLPAGTKLQWLDGAVPDGLDQIANPLFVTVANPLAGGTDVPIFGEDLVQYAAIYESVGAPNLDLELFSSAIGATPALVLVWEGSESADGLTMSTMNRGTARVARGRLAYKEQWSLLVITSRQDSDMRRRAEGMRILENCSDLLFDQIWFDDVLGIRVSDIDGVQIRSRFRLAGRTPFYQQYYVYGVRLATTRVYSKYDPRTFATWRTANISSVNPDTNLPTDPNPLPTTTNVKTTIPQDP
ncbi:MAG TPA: hypothetical protein VH062_02235 [Polyangiaceae bacterium]|nr:hypothetical protein [Polyangiaceae bacterium]